MNQTPACPRCGEPTVVGGHVIEGGDSTGSPRFLPEGLQIKRFTDQWWGVAVTARFRGCLSCGLVWSGLDANRLHSFLLEHGGELTRQQVDEWDRGPLRGLPDTALARQVAANVAEIDHLVRSGKPAAALTRFQELTGATRDQAFAVTHDWPNLTRAAKLGHFGWVEKKPGPVDDLAEPLL